MGNSENRKGAGCCLLVVAALCLSAGFHYSEPYRQVSYDGYSLKIGEYPQSRQTTGVVLVVIGFALGIGGLIASLRNDR